MAKLVELVTATIRDIPDFPKPGIVFKDITPVLQDPELFQGITDRISSRFRSSRVDAVVGMESRGFIFGCPIALAMGCSFVPARKPGKLPYESVGVEYELEYGTNRLEMHTDAVKPGDQVLIVDDLLATGGTAKATVELVRRLGAEVVGCAFVVELSFLEGRAALGGVPVDSIVIY